MYPEPEGAAHELGQADPGWGLASTTGSRTAALIRPVSARSYNNAAAAEHDSPVSGGRPGTAFRRMGHTKAVDFLSGSVTQYSNHLFDDSEGDDSPARTPNAGYVPSRPPTAALQQSVAALKRKERSLSGGLAVANDTMSRTMRPGTASGLRPLSPRSPIADSAAEADSVLEQYLKAPQSEIVDEPEEVASSQQDPYGGPRASPKKARSGEPRSETPQDIERELYDHSIEPVYEPISPVSEVAPSPSSTVDISDVRAFLMQPGPRGRPVQCHIRREKGRKAAYPVFVLCISDGDRFLVAARNEPKAKTSNYIISLDQEDYQPSSGNYFGKLRANFMGTEFWFYDGGADCSSQAAPSLSSGGQSGERSMLGCVTYQYNVLGTRGPRKMTGVIPRLDADGQPADLGANCKRKDQAILGKFRRREELEKMVIMRNKPPKWNDQLGAYCLNFNGRVTHASVKNFQLVADEDKEIIILQFGKAGPDLFTLDYQYPMSALQAFAICLTSLDNKLACE